MLTKELKQFAMDIANDSKDRKAEITASVSGENVGIKAEGNIHGIFFTLGYMVYTCAKKTGLSTAAVSYIGNVLAAGLEQMDEEGSLNTKERPYTGQKSKRGTEKPAEACSENLPSGVDGALWD